MKTFLVDAINTFVIKGDGIFKKMHQLLEKYPNKKIILTGANDEQMIEFGLNEMPYDVFTLKHDPEKKDPNYYTSMLNTYNLRAKDVIYFEHDKNAVESAESVGINTFHYEQNKKDLVALKEFIEMNL